MIFLLYVIIIKKAIRKDFHAGEHVFPFSLLESSFFEFI